MDLDLVHLRGWIGREEVAAETATPELVRRFIATLGLALPCEEGGVAPGMIHLCLGQPAVAEAELGPDGHPARGGFLPPVPLPRRMWAGGELVFHDDIRVGERVARSSRIRDVQLKDGRSGPLCFVTVDHRIESGGRLVIDERQDIVYREFAPAGGPSAYPATPARAAGRVSRRVVPSAPLLFRYSALTFNGHRIHYDSTYAREVEGYPGLVVHGPLQATLLLHLARELLGSQRTPRRFRFRGLTPIFNTADFTLNAEEFDGGLRLWTAMPGGPTAMEAFAED